MAKAVGIGLTAIFVLASLLGTAASGWVLGEALSPARAGMLVGSLSLGMVLALLAAAVEGLRLALSLRGERIWHGSQFQGIAFAAPLWLACTGYCILMPLLALAFVPLLPAESLMLTVIAPAWAAVQIAAGLLPGIEWSSAEAAKPAGRMPPARSPAADRASLQVATEPTLSADDLFRFLGRLSGLPAGSTLPRRGRIGSNGEIVISQAGLAALVGRSKPTVRRWLQELERGGRIAKRTTGRDTRILLQQLLPKPNGDARVLNGEVRI